MKKVYNRKKFIKNLLEDIDKTSKKLNESYILNDEDSLDELADDQLADAEDAEIESDDNIETVPAETEITDDNTFKQDPNISAIREAALDGLKKYSNDVDSEMYIFFKKIYLESDKIVSQKSSVNPQ